MNIVLEVKSENRRGEKFWLRPGQAVVVGRTEYADIVLPFDEQLSATHFSISCDRQACRLRDLESTSGTQVNGQSVTEQTLGNGDTIIAGATHFTVMVDGESGCETTCDCAVDVPAAAIAPSPITVSRRADELPARVVGPPQLEPLELRVGSWQFDRIPSGWLAVESQGMRRVASGPLAAKLVAQESSWSAGPDLAGHVGTLAEAVRQSMKIPVDGPSAVRLGDSIDGLSMVLHHAEAARMRLVQRQIFVTDCERLGILSLLADESEFSEADEVFSNLLPHISFAPADRGTLSISESMEKGESC